MSTSIHQEIVFKAGAERVYEALMRSDQFSALTGGAPAEISRDEGGAISLFGGKITGRNVELVPGQRIVQAWRAGNWEAGVYSVVKIELKAEGGETRLVLDHTGFPEDQAQHLDPGWHKMYWEPLRQHLS